MPGTREEDVWDGCIELFDNSLFLSFSGQIHKYNFKTRQWQILDFPGQKQSRLFAIDGHLYAANDETILEITDGGKGTRLLASTRRRPAASALDRWTVSVRRLCLQVRTICSVRHRSKIYGWDERTGNKCSPWTISKSWSRFDDGFIFPLISGQSVGLAEKPIRAGLVVERRAETAAGIRNNA